MLTRRKVTVQLLGKCADLEADVGSSQHLFFLAVTCLLQRQRNTTGSVHVAAVVYINIANDALASVLWFLFVSCPACSKVS